jgi:hypothetical protein
LRFKSYIYLNCSDLLIRYYRKISTPQFTRIVEDVERIRKRQVASGKDIQVLCDGLMQRAFVGELSTGNA